MGQFSMIEFAIQGPAAWITLARPEQMNALSMQLAQELDMALAQCTEDARVRVVVLTGSGRAFCAGADLKEVLASKDLPAGSPDFLEVLGRVFQRLRSFPKPVIAAVNGLALAGGLELVLTADIVFAAESARLGDAHANFGVFPGAGGAAILPRRIGLNRAKFLLFSGEQVSAREMMQMGLVNEVVPDEALREHVAAFVTKIADKSPVVLRRMKEVANHAMDQSERAALIEEQLNLREHMRSYDIQEGLTAFREKRKPVFRGY